jgi:hypothetical protein
VGGGWRKNPCAVFSFPGRVRSQPTTETTFTSHMSESQEPPLPMFMTAAEVNQRIRKCHPLTLRRALRAGRIKGKQHGMRIYYESQSVINWMRGSEPAPERPTSGLKRRRGRPRKAVAR